MNEVAAAIAGPCHSCFFRAILQVETGPENDQGAAGKMAPLTSFLIPRRILLR